MPGNPCTPCYPPKEYYPAGVAPAELPGGVGSSSKDWPSSEKCYQPQSIPLPITLPEQKACVAPNYHECCIPNQYNLRKHKNTPDCCELKDPRDKYCNENETHSPTGMSEKPGKHVHFADSVPGEYRPSECPKYVPEDDPTNQPGQPVLTQETEGYVPQQTLSETPKQTACYHPIPRDALPSVPPLHSCYCFPPSESIKPEPPEGPPCYLPQPENALSTISAEGGVKQEMGPIGAWATGKMDWGPLKGFTGTRPVVDRYSITRFSEGEWREHNNELLKETSDRHIHANVVDFNSQRCMEMTAASTDKSQAENTNRLRHRAHEVHHWKCELEHAISAMAYEINLVELQRQRLKTAMGVLQLPESIAGECLERRTTRLENDLVRDQAEEELIKEVSLMSEVRDLLNRLLKQMELQITADKAIKQRLEMDWSDKKEVHELETINVNLKNSSPTLLFKPGATRFPEGQSTPESWTFFSKENLGMLEAERLKSVDLRSYLDKILTDVIRDLRMQADRVDKALENRIAITEACRERLENDLLKILHRISDSEKLIIQLKEAIRNQDAALKKAQTRLSNRLLRPRLESCRDHPQYGLVDEVKTIHENVAAQRGMLKQAEDSLQSLFNIRGDLEREIMVKRKSLQVDRDRCRDIRSHYPSAVALSGY